MNRNFFELGWKIKADIGILKADKGILKADIGILKAI